VLVALAFVVSGAPPACVSTERLSSDIAHVELQEFSFATLAASLVKRLLHTWPDSFSSGTKEVTLGTLCSGADFIVDMAHALVAEVNRQAHANLKLLSVFACEKNSQVRQFRDHLGRRGTCYPDVHALPEDIPSTDILVFGSSCTSLSQLCNRKRDLTHTDPQDPLASSGATMKSCLQYVTNKLPQVVLFENVPGILGRIAGEDGRNIDKVYNQLYAAGYSCQHAVFDSQSFMLPQRRRRVYAMATRGDIDPECCAAWPRLVRACSPLERIPLSACLL
jgi:site-specific DNA-cytosine methylase